jgi:hypothetical protein
MSGIFSGKETLELFKEILDTQGMALALYFLHDSQADIKLMAEIETNQAKRVYLGTFPFKAT